MAQNWRRTRYACYLASITQAINVNLAPLLFVIFRSEFGFSLEQIGRIILINFSTQIVADILATKYADRIGYRVSIMASLVLSVTGLVLLSILPRVTGGAYAGLVIPVMLFSLGSGFIEVLTSPLVESIPGDEKAAMMSLLHSFYCWGQMSVVLITTLLIWWLDSSVWYYLPILWAIVPAVDFFVFMKAPIGSIVAEGGKPMKIGELLKSGFFWAAMLLMICAGSSELTMSQWSSLFAETGLGVSKLVGDLLGPCLFAIFMGITRAVYGIKGAKINLHKVLLASAALTVVCYAVTIFAPHPLLSLTGCALCGAGVGLMWPGTLSFSAARFPMGGTAMFGILAICGDIGGAFAPWLAGVVSDGVQQSESMINMAAEISLGMEQMGLRCGLLLGMIFPICMFIVLLILLNGGRKQTD